MIKITEELRQQSVFQADSGCRYQSQEILQTTHFGKYEKWPTLGSSFVTVSSHTETFQSFKLLEASRDTNLSQSSTSPACTDCNQQS